MNDSQEDERPVLHWVPAVDANGRNYLKGVWSLPSAHSFPDQQAHAA